MKDIIVGALIYLIVALVFPLSSTANHLFASIMIIFVYTLDRIITEDRK